MLVKNELPQEEKLSNYMIHKFQPFCNSKHMRNFNIFMLKTILLYNSKLKLEFGKANIIEYLKYLEKHEYL